MNNEVVQFSIISSGFYSVLQLCSALIHPFSSSILPPDSEVCLALFNNQVHPHIRMLLATVAFICIIKVISMFALQTQKDIQGRLRIGSKDRLAFFGKVHFNSLHSRHQEIQVKVNFTHQLQVNPPLFSYKSFCRRYLSDSCSM